MNKTYFCLIVFVLIVFVCDKITSKKTNNKNKKPVSNDDEDEEFVDTKIYSNMFVRRREEHKLLYKHLMNLDSYEKKYKMLEIAYNKIFDVIQENRENLKKSDFVPSSDKILIFEALILENFVLFGDLVLHIPDISYAILKTKGDWREILDYGFQMSEKKHELIDETTVKMLSILHQEMNESERSDDFVNPYYQTAKVENLEKKQKKKKVKKLKKGPTLYSVKNEL